MVNNLNTKYWNNYYKNKNLTKKPTKFAIYCKSKLKKYKGVLYDIGCGNGRDVVYFNEKKIFCIGLDKSSSAISYDKLFFSSYKNKFQRANFCNFFSKQIKNTKFSVYSRFSLHSINYNNEKKLFFFLIKQKNLDYLFLETRILEDELYGVGKKVGKHEFISTHYRRFIDPFVLKKKLNKYFKIIQFKKSKNFAKFKKENPCVLRIIAKRK